MAEPALRPALRIAAALVVFAAAVLVHLPTLGFEFLSWDDPEHVVDNPWIRGASLEHLRFVLTQPYMANYLPLWLLSYMLDHAIWGLDPFGFHLQSVLLAAVNAVLALLVTQRIFGSSRLALIAALLFALHPTHVEPVAWISSRKDLLSTAFALGAVLLYLRATASQSLARGAYLASLVCFALGLLSKVGIAAAPLFLLALDRFRPPGETPIPWRTAVASKLPYLLVGALLAAVNALAQVTSEPLRDPLAYLMLKGHAVWAYLVLLSGATTGRPIYDAPQLASGAIAVATNLAGLVVLPALIAVAWRARWRMLALAATWVLAMLLPAVAFPLVTYMADRYLYAPSLGICWLLAAGILALARRVDAAPLRTGVAATLTAVACAFFAVRTLAYQPVWADSETLWSHAMTRSRDQRIQLNLARALVAEERWDEAERLYRQATAVENFPAHQGLATVLYQLQRLDEAEREMRRARAIASRRDASPVQLAEIEYGLGVILWARAKPDEAFAAWEAALRHDPRHAHAAELLAQLRRPSGSAD